MPGGGDAETQLDLLAARQAITDKLHQYCYAVDGLDAPLGHDVWNPDGTADYGDFFVGSGHELIDRLVEQHSRFRGTSHQVTNVRIDVDLAADRATSEAYVTACNRHGELDILIRARYQDTWSRRNGVWRIDTRLVVSDLLNVVPVRTL
jgi:SnoaL-like domain